MESRSGEELITVDQWGNTGEHHTGGPYGDRRETGTPSDPPNWMRWWAQEHRFLVETLADPDHDNKGKDS